MMILSIMTTLAFQAASSPSPLPSRESFDITTWFLQGLPSVAMVESLERVAEINEADEVTIVVAGVGGVLDDLTKQEVATETSVDVRGGNRYDRCNMFLVPMLCMFLFAVTLMFGCNNKKRPTYDVTTAVPKQTKILTVKPLQCRAGDAQTVVTV